MKFVTSVMRRVSFLNCYIQLLSYTFCSIKGTFMRVLWLSADDLFVSSLKVFPDKFMRREVQAFVVHCTFEDEGCIWKGEVRHLEVNNWKQTSSDLWYYMMTVNIFIKGVYTCTYSENFLATSFWPLFLSKLLLAVVFSLHGYWCTLIKTCSVQVFGIMAHIS